MSSGNEYICGVDVFQGLTCWGKNDEGQCDVPELPADEFWRMVSGGTLHTCGVTSRNRVLCWGSEDGANVPASVANATVWQKVSCGYRHSCALSISGNVTCWGMEADPEDQRPMPLGKSWLDIGTGDLFSCGLTVEREVYCWGTVRQERPGDLNILWDSIKVGAYTVCGIEKDDVIYCWGANKATSANVVSYGLASGSLSLLFLTSKGTMGIAAPLAQPYPGPVLPGGVKSVIDTIVGQQHACFHTSTGSLSCFANIDHSLAVAPVHVSSEVATDWTFLKSDFASACGILHYVILRCWGSITAQPPATIDKKWSEISLGRSHVCGLSDTGTISCWGNSGFGQISGGEEYLNSSQQWIAVAAGGYVTCGIRSDHALFCWGIPDFGQLSVPGGDLDWRWSQLAVADTHTCAITVDGAMVCWGENTFEQTQVPPIGNGTWTSVSVSQLMSCGTLEDGRGLCWGSNLYGQTNVPQLNEWRYIAAGGYHACGQLFTKEVVCWGYSGDGSTTVPTLTPGDSWVDVSCGARHTCASSVLQGVRCWGYALTGVTQVPRFHIVDPGIVAAVYPSVFSTQVIASSLGVITNPIMQHHHSLFQWGGFVTPLQGTVGASLSDFAAITLQLQGDVWSNQPLPQSIREMRGIRLVAQSRDGYSCVLSSLAAQCMCWNMGDAVVVSRGDSIPLKGTKKIVIGQHGAVLCFLNEENRAECTGFKSPFSVSDVSDIALGSNVFCAALANGSVVAMGQDHIFWAEPPSGETYVAVDCLPPVFCALSNLLRLDCWGLTSPCWKALSPESIVLDFALTPQGITWTGADGQLCADAEAFPGGAPYASSIKHSASVLVFPSGLHPLCLGVDRNDVVCSPHELLEFVATSAPRSLVLFIEGDWVMNDVWISALNQLPVASLHIRGLSRVSEPCHGDCRSYLMCSRSDCLNLESVDELRIEDFKIGAASSDTFLKIHAHSVVVLARVKVAPAIQIDGVEHLAVAASAFYAPLTISSGNRVEIYSSLWAYINNSSAPLSVFAVDSLAVSDTTFSNTIGEKAGGVYVNSVDSVTISASSFSNCMSLTDGGGAYVRDVNSLTFENFTAENCAAAEAGGAIYIESPPPRGSATRRFRFTSVHVANCTATHGGGFALVDTHEKNFSHIETKITLHKAKFTNCHADNDGGGFYLSGTPKQRVIGVELAQVVELSGLTEMEQVGVSYSGCTATGRGGAMFLREVYLFTDGNFTSNTAESGGAIYITGGDIHIQSGSLSNNSATSTGGDILATGCYLSGVASFDSTFSDSWAGESGGSLFLRRCKLALKDTLHCGSSAGLDGGAAYVTDIHSVSLEGARFYSSTAERNGGAVCFMGIADLTVSNSQFHSCRASSGGAVLLDAVTAVFEDVELLRVSSTQTAGALLAAHSYISASSLKCGNCTVESSEPGHGGGCIALYREGHLDLNGAHFYGNSAFYGGDIYLDCFSHVVVPSNPQTTSERSNGTVGTSVFAECKLSTSNPLRMVARSSEQPLIATAVTQAAVSHAAPVIYGADMMEEPVLRLVLLDSLNRTASEDSWTQCSIHLKGLAEGNVSAVLSLLTPNVYIARGGVVLISPFGIQAAAVHTVIITVTCTAFMEFHAEAVFPARLPELEWVSASPRFLSSSSLSPLYLSPPPIVRLHANGRALNISGGTCTLSLLTSDMVLHGELLIDLLDGSAAFPRAAVDGAVEMPISLLASCRLASQILLTTDHLAGLPFSSFLSFVNPPFPAWLPISPGSIHFNELSVVWRHTRPSLVIQGSCMVAVDNGKAIGTTTAVLVRNNNSASIAEFSAFGIQAQPGTLVNLTFRCASHTGGASQSLFTAAAIADWKVVARTSEQLVHRMSTIVLDVAVTFSDSTISAKAKDQSALKCEIEGTTPESKLVIENSARTISGWRVENSSVIGATELTLNADRGSEIYLEATCSISSFVRKSHLMPLVIRRTFLRWTGLDEAGLLRQWLPSSSIAKQPLQPMPILEVYDGDANQPVNDTSEYSCRVSLSEQSILSGASLLSISTGSSTYWGEKSSSLISFPTILIDSPLNTTVQLIFSCVRSGVDEFEAMFLDVHLLKPNVVFLEDPPLSVSTGSAFHIAIAVLPTLSATTELDIIECSITLDSEITSASLDGGLPVIEQNKFNFSSLVLRGAVGETYEFVISCNVGGRPLIPLRHSIQSSLCEPGFEPDEEIRSCRRCGRSQYSPGGSEPCLPCPLAGVECNGGTLHLLPGYFPANTRAWLSPAARLKEDTVLYPCWIEEACTKDNVTRESLPCAAGYQGPLCGICTGGRVRSGGSCVDCWPTWASVLTVLVVAAAVIGFLAYVAVYQTHKSAASHGKALLRMVLSYTQILSALGIFAARATDAFRSLVGITDVVGSSIFQVVPFQCLFPMGFFTRFALTIALPCVMALASILVAVCVFAIRSLLPMENKVTLSIRFSSFKAQLQAYLKSGSYLSAVLFVLYVLYNSVVYSTSSMLKCRPEVLDNNQVLEADLSIICYDSSHITGIVVAVLVAIIYNLGYPLFILWILRRHRSALRSSRISGRFGFLYQGYSLTRGVYWWEAVVMVRKLLIIMAGSLIEDPWYQIIAGITILFISLVLQLKFSPHDQPLFNRLEAAILTVLCLTQMISLVYLRAETVTKDPERRLPVSVAVTATLLTMNATMYIVLLLLALSSRVKLLGRCFGVGKNVRRQLVSDYVTGRRGNSISRGIRNSVTPTISETGDHDVGEVPDTKHATTQSLPSVINSKEDQPEGLVSSTQRELMMVEPVTDQFPLQWKENPIRKLSKV